MVRTASPNGATPARTQRQFKGQASHDSQGRALPCNNPLRILRQIQRERKARRELEREKRKRTRRAEKMNREKYQQYLLTDHWKQLRSKVIERDGNACCWCKCTAQLQVHHKIYRATPYDTILEDLETLCEACHAGIHGKEAKKLKPKKERRKIEVFGRFFTVDTASVVRIVEYLSPETPETKAGIHHRATWIPTNATPQPRLTTSLRLGRLKENSLTNPAS